MSKNLWTVNTLKGPQHCLNMHGSIFVIFFITLKKSSSKNYDFVVSEILRLFANILTPGESYDLSVKASVYRNQFKGNYLKNLKKSLNFLLVFRNLYKLWNPWKNKDELQTLFVSEIIECKKRGHLNPQKASCQNTYGEATC